MPIKSNKNLGIGSPTPPMFPQIHAENDKEESDLSFFLLFLGSAIAKKPDSTCSESNELINEINHI